MHSMWARSPSSRAASNDHTCSPFYFWLLTSLRSPDRWVRPSGLGGHDHPNPLKISRLLRDGADLSATSQPVTPAPSSEVSLQSYVGHPLSQSLNLITLNGSGFDLSQIDIDDANRQSSIHHCVHDRFRQTIIHLTDGVLIGHQI